MGRQRPRGYRDRGLPLKGAAMTLLQVPVHPGEVLKHEFLEPLGLSAGKLARHIHVPRTRIERLCGGETSVTIDTARRLARAFGTSVEFWMTLQMKHDLVRSGAETDLSDIRPLRVA
ncbi:MAG: HigA family addiction module antitoxin [Gemmobacter sp.]